MQHMDVCMTFTDAPSMRPTPEGVGNDGVAPLRPHLVIPSMRPTPEGVGNHVLVVRTKRYQFHPSMRPTPEGVGNKYWPS